MKRGDTFAFVVTVTQNGAIFDLTSCNMRMTAKYNYTDADGAAVFTLTVGSGIVLTSPTAGIATITVPSSATSPLPATRQDLYYDVQVTDTLSNVYTVVSGSLTVFPDVSITTP